MICLIENHIFVDDLATFTLYQKSSNMRPVKRYSKGQKVLEFITKEIIYTKYDNLNR